MATFKHNIKLSIMPEGFDNAVYANQFQSFNKSMAKMQDNINLAFDMLNEINGELNTDAANNVAPVAFKYHNKRENKKSLCNNDASQKSQLKTALKLEIKKKFKKGDFICLRTKAKGGCKRIDRIYQIKQIVWSMNDLAIKALVVKQIVGPNYNMFSMNRHDCARVHVKYEPGLQFLSMELPWIPAKPALIPEQYKK